MHYLGNPIGLIPSPVAVTAPELIAIEPTMASILDAYPTLWWGGWWLTRDDQNERDGRGPSLAKCREEMVSPWGIGQFERAAQFIAQAPRTAGINRSHGTYGWKHAAERLYKRRNGLAGNYYVGEGSFIAAAIALGLIVHRNAAGDTSVNLSDKAFITDALPLVSRRRR